MPDKLQFFSSPPGKWPCFSNRIRSKNVVNGYNNKEVCRLISHCGLFTERAISCQSVKCPNIKFCSNIVKDQKPQSGMAMSVQTCDIFIHLVSFSVVGCMVQKAYRSHVDRKCMLCVLLQTL